MKPMSTTPSTSKEASIDIKKRSFKVCFKHRAIKVYEKLGIYFLIILTIFLLIITRKIVLFFLF